MGVAVFMDTVFAFQMLLLGMLALSTIYVDVLYINVNTGFFCGVLCANFLVCIISGLLLWQIIGLWE